MEVAPKLETLADRLKSTRERLQLSVDNIAQEIAVEPVTVAEFESGARLPTLPQLTQLAGCLNTSTDYLLGLPAPPPDSLLTLLSHVKGRRRLILVNAVRLALGVDDDKRVP